MRSVLFVCTANICRSPMAEGLMRYHVSEHNPYEDDDVWRIQSAGTWAIDGAPAAVNSIRAMEERKIDIRKHRSRLITLGIMQEFNLILTMENGHKEALHVEFPDLASRVYLISEMIGKHFNIVDPIGGPLVDFRDTADEIEHILTSGFSKISELSG